MNWVLVILGGAAGAACRYGADRMANSYLGSSLLGTFSVNIIGSLILGFLVGCAFNKANWNQEYSLLLGVGFCGSFTTFSTVTVSSVQLMSNGNYTKAIFYLVSSVVIGLIAALVGIWLAKLPFNFY
ncbi:MAG: fluoride efflux transporter CrcB [SAR202 cluster bacterium]|jgi:CrcB protein|nr:MAG: fluoride efflux transporter CrcB [SAR202 cluster bacterium]MAR86180.1 fluoride efflux transporter CrcB [Chloroflexota bacterium]PKB59814.1 MAG: hypothetical protein BZY65_02970 [SAR202 cluster bacterium Ae2-Chloro-G2]KAA1302412.1 MAG: fluoride efflux transporter CrcB [SAR202 cluster bacterium]MED5409180.1 fluoride efflux transporter CrcB [Chloroflexota bacterium]|tara:strand:- start:1716 stop:2096 length:381 start_codon:yes stop_codon:yes gene_type:complete